MFASSLQKMINKLTKLLSDNEQKTYLKTFQENIYKNKISINIYQSQQNE